MGIIFKRQGILKTKLLKNANTKKDCFPKSEFNEYLNILLTRVRKVFKGVNCLQKYGNPALFLKTPQLGWEFETVGTDH